MSLQLKGIVHEIQDLQQGENQDGKPWSRLTFVIAVTSGPNGEYTDYVPFTIMKPELIDSFLQYTKVGQEVEVSFNLRGREWQGRWFLDAQAWKVWRENKNAAPEAQVEEGEVLDFIDAEEDDLPF